MHEVHLEALAADNLDAFAAFLGRGEFGGCFCAVWTRFGADWEQRCGDPTRPNLAATRADVEAGRKPGFLVRSEGEIVAWTGAGAKSHFPLLSGRLGARLSRYQEETWCVGCFAVRADRRGHGLPESILRAVTEEARRNGAARIEAYPTDPWDEPRSYRGSASLFRRVGFREEARESDGDADIVLMARNLTAPTSP